MGQGNFFAEQNETGNPMAIVLTYKTYQIKPAIYTEPVCLQVQ